MSSASVMPAMLYVLMLFAIPSYSLSNSNDIGETEINEKWLEGIMIRDANRTGKPSIERITSLKLSPFDPPGVNYGSNRTKAEMSLLLKSGDASNTSVIVVSLPSNPLRNKQIQNSGLFVTDINVYDKVLPEINNFEYEGKNRERKMWVDSIELEKYTRLVLEDPTRYGYALKDMREGLDMTYCKDAVKALAKFHALSAAAESGNLISVKPFDKSLAERNSEKIDDWFGQVFDEFVKSIRAAWGPEWEDTAKVFDAKSKTITQDRLKILKRNDSSFNALLVGAFYINNLYFKNARTTSAPIDAKVLDFQNAFWNTPALELQLFLNTSPEPEIITDDLLRQEIVYHYANNLIGYLKLFGYKSSVSLDDVRNEVRRTELIGLCDAMNFLSGIYLKPEDAPYTEQFIIDALKNKKIKIDSKGMILPRYINVMKKLVTRAQKLGVI